MTDTTDNGKQQRRPLTREEREAMKRELKAQLRAYVDALKEQMLNAKEQGKEPDLEEAMSQAEREAERRLRQEAAQGDPMVKEAAAVQAAARRQQAQAQQAQQTARAPRHDGVIPRFSAWRPAAEDDAKENDRGHESDSASDAGKDVMNVATTQNDTQKADTPDAAAPASADAGARITVNPGKSDAQDDAARNDYIVPEEEAAKSAIPREELERLTRDIIAALKTIYDPEIPVDIYELGLIYRIDIADDRTVTIDMTLTAPGCPVAGDMPGWVQKAVSEVEGVKEVKVNLVFDPPWDTSRMSDEARLALNMF